MKTKDWIIEIVAGLLVLLFSYTAVSKVLEYEKFIFQMKLAPLPLMKTWAGTLAWLVPLVEAVIVTLLLLPRWRRLGLWASIVLLGVFEAYIGCMMLTGDKLPCTCGGIISKMGWGQHLVFNASFILLGWLAIRAIDNKWPFRPKPKPEYLSRREA